MIELNVAESDEQVLEFSWVLFLLSFVIHLSFMSTVPYFLFQSTLIHLTDT